MNQLSGSRVRPRAWQLAVTFGLAQIITLGLLLGPLLGQPWFDGFRRYFANDQLSYAAIATNVAHGQMGLVEPFTQTGSLYYPSLWYQVMGLIARVTHLPVYFVWTLMGLAVVGAAVATVGWLAYRWSNRAFAPLLPALVLLTGTFSVIRVDNWFTPISSHAVLWGPYGTLFTLNAEVAGLSLGAIGLSLLLAASLPPPITSWSARRRAWHVVAAAAIIGLLANIQTYSFFSVACLAAFFIASRSLLMSRSRTAGLATGILLIAVVGLGSQIAKVVGPLPMFGLLLAALAPAAWFLVRRHPRLSAVALVVAAAAAAPQVVRTMIGLAEGDPFLTYRQASTLDLSVPLGDAVIAALPMLAIGAACAIAVWSRRQPTLAALLIAIAAGGVLMTANDRWGFSQEPYRFWMQYAILGALLLMPVLAWSLSTIPSLTLSARIAFVAVAALAAVAWLVSVQDLPRFWAYARDQGVISAQDDRAQAVRALLGAHEDLVASSACLDPRELKLISPGPVAFYNAGLAWPEDEPAFKIFQDVERRATEDPAALTAAHVRYVLTDSTCLTDWTFPANQQVVPVAVRDYAVDDGTAKLTLWLVQPA